MESKISYFFISLENFIFDHFLAKIDWVSEKYQILCPWKVFLFPWKKRKNCPWKKKTWAWKIWKMGQKVGVKNEKCPWKKSKKCQKSVSRALFIFTGKKTLVWRGQTLKNFLLIKTFQWNSFAFQNMWISLQFSLLLQSISKYVALRSPACLQFCYIRSLLRMPYLKVHITKNKILFNINLTWSTRRVFIGATIVFWIAYTMI